MHHAREVSVTGPDHEQLKNLFNHSLDMLAIAENGYLVRVNPAWALALGWPSDELTATPLLEFVHPEDVEATKEALRELIDGVPTTTFLNRIRHRDGGYRMLRWSLRPEGGLVYVGARDITTNAARREHAERGEAVATAVLQTAVDPIIVIDTQGKIVDANDATSKLFGYQHDELIGRNVSMLMPDPYRSDHDEYLSRYLREGDARIIGIGREVTAQRDDGTCFPMALAVSEVLTDTDHLFTGIIHDLTERNQQRDALQTANKLLESRVADRTRQLKELLDEVQRSNRDLEHFAYIASHDLQAPLRNVRQGLELLDEHLADTIGTRFDDEAQELRDLVVAAVLRMEELIKGLLAYSRVQQSPVDERQLLDMNVVVGDVVTMLMPEVNNVGGSIVVADLPQLTVNPTQVRQVFQNLIENAIRYRSSERDLEIVVEVREQQATSVVIAVRDNGSGIDAAHHERIFDLFRRGHSGYDGVGLGLAICKRIVEGHSGKIWVESGAEQGASFCIRLPLTSGAVR